MTTRVNRTVLALLGLLFLAAGVLGLVLSFGGFGSERAETPVLPDQLRSFAAENPWFWWLVALAGVLVALLGLRWLLVQLRTDRSGPLDLTDDDRTGITTLDAGAVCDGMEAETRTIRGVTAATAHLRSSDGAVHLRVGLADHADVAEVRARLEETVVPHLRQVVDDPQLPVDIELRLERTGGRGLR